MDVASAPNVSSGPGDGPLVVMMNSPARLGMEARIGSARRGAEARLGSTRLGPEERLVSLSIACADAMDMACTRSAVMARAGLTAAVWPQEARSEGHHVRISRCPDTAWAEEDALW